MSHFLLNHFLSTYFEGHVSIFQSTPEMLMFKAVIAEEKRIIFMHHGLNKGHLLSLNLHIHKIDNLVILFLV